MIEEMVLVFFGFMLSYVHEVVTWLKDKYWP